MSKPEHFENEDKDSPGTYRAETKESRPTASAGSQDLM